MKPLRHSLPSLVGALFAGALLGGFGPSLMDGISGGDRSPPGGHVPATGASATSITGSSTDRQMKSGARVSAAYAGAWEILKDGEIDPYPRAALQRALLEEWCMLDLDAALRAAIGESMIGSCSPGIAAKSEEVWAWIRESKFGLSTWPLLHTWIEVAGETDPRMLLRRYEEIPPDPVPVKRSPREISPGEPASDEEDPFAANGWRDSGFMKEAPQTLGGASVPFETEHTPRERALLEIVNHAHREDASSSMAGELMTGVASLAAVEKGGYQRDSIVLLLASYSAEALEMRLRAGSGSPVRNLYLDAYADKLRQVEPTRRAAESAHIPEDLRDEILQHFGPLDAK
jgi:hypothetical protein